MSSHVTCLKQRGINIWETSSVLKITCITGWFAPALLLSSREGQAFSILSTLWGVWWTNGTDLFLLSCSNQALPRTVLCKWAGKPMDITRVAPLIVACLWDFVVVCSTAKANGYISHEVFYPAQLSCYSHKPLHVGFFILIPIIFLPV